jgi:hypothetical protein
VREMLQSTIQTLQHSANPGISTAHLHNRIYRDYMFCERNLEKSGVSFSNRRPIIPKQEPVAWETNMQSENSITSFNALQPAFVRSIREAFDDTIKAVEERRGPGAPPPSDDVRAKISKLIVGMARHGVSDVKRLRDETLSALHLAP